MREIESDELDQRHGIEFGREVLIDVSEFYVALFDYFAFGGREGAFYKIDKSRFSGAVTPYQRSFRVFAYYEGRRFQDILRGV